jgi:CubicO group peptidase (beta-lactamase class C family)
MSAGAAATVEALLARARRDVENGWLPACQLAVARDGELVVFETFGDAGNDTRFCVFSVTKPLVASAFWLVMAECAVDPASTVASFLPEFAGNGKGAVTVEQVLLHTCGFPVAPMPLAEAADPEARRRRMASWRLDWEPGSRFEYHALSAHWVLAELIERLSGADYRDFIDDRVCRPLGLPRLLGARAGGGEGGGGGDGGRGGSAIAPLTWVGKAEGTTGWGDLTWPWHDPDVVALGVPGAGGVATAADVALFYQALLTNPGGLWDAGLLADATGNIRCTFPDPVMGVPVNRTLGLVVAGDDGLHTLRYGAFAEGNSPRAFGHAGSHVQVAWADPATGISFSYLTNGLDKDSGREGLRSLRLSNLAASLGTA